jgi:diguanylate cyclase (GGDEF)-like protein/PAS domain S-box-containing protein
MNLAAIARFSREIRLSVRRATIRYLILSFVFVLTYLFITLPQVTLISHIGSTVWYPAIGLAMALMLGVSPWYALLVCFCDALVGSLIYQQPLRSWSETLGAAGLAVCYGTAAYVLRGPLQIDLRLSRRKDVVRYTFLTLAAAAGSTLIGVACLALDNAIKWNEFGISALTWFLGDAVALLGVTPFLLLHVFPRVRRFIAPILGKHKEDAGFAAFNTEANVELLCQSFALLAVLWAMFGINDGRYGHFYTCFIPIIWIAMRQGIRRVVTAVLILNFGIVLAVRVFPPEAIVTAKLGFFMLVISATGLIVGSEVSERERTAMDLHKQTDYLSSLIQNSPLGIVVLDHEGRVELVNTAFERLSLYEQHELRSVDLDRLMLSNDKPRESEQDIIPRVFAGEALQVVVPWRRKDGKVIQVRINAVPLMLDGRVRGAYELCQDVSEYMEAREAKEKHAESVNQVVNELQRHTSEMALLNDMRDWLECCETEAEACLVVGQSIPKLVPECVSGTLYLFKATRELAEAAVSWGKASASESTFTAGHCWCLRRGRAHWSEPGTAGIRCSHLGPTDVGSLCVPVIAQGTTQGVLHLEFPCDAESKSESDTESWRDSRRRLAISVAGHIATSLSSLRLRETLREQSIRDPLTGLFNRRFLEESLETELQRAKRNETPVSVLLLDLDHFKRINDTFGHDAGDLVLRSVASIFRRFFRGGDICCRYGGEEFAIILPECSSPCAAVRANALRTELKRLTLHYKSYTLEPVTVSIGATTFPEHGTTALALLSKADECLYESKSKGRDRVTIHSLDAPDGAASRSGSQPTQ